MDSLENVLIKIELFSRYSPTLPWFQLVGIALVNALGYVIFRASETQRCEFAKDPESPALKRKYIQLRVETNCCQALRIQIALSKVLFHI